METYTHVQDFSLRYVFDCDRQFICLAVACKDGSIASLTELILLHIFGLKRI